MTEATEYKFRACEAILRTSGVIGGKMLQSVLASVPVFAWTGIETLLGDLWEGTINCCPDLAAKESVSVATVKEITAGNYALNLKRKIGTALRHDKDFQSLAKAQEFYKITFIDHSDAIKSVFTSPSFERLSLVRNLLVHKSGIVDVEYQTRAKRFKGLPTAPLNVRISISGNDLEQLIAPAIVSAIQLVHAVDSWIARYAYEEKGERTGSSEVKETLTPLEKPCSQCNGSGRIGAHRCDVCQGSGYEVTPMGHRILDLLRHNFKPMF